MRYRHPKPERERGVAPRPGSGRSGPSSVSCRLQPSCAAAFRHMSGTWTAGYDFKAGRRVRVHSVYDRCAASMNRLQFSFESPAIEAAFRRLTDAGPVIAAVGSTRTRPGSYPWKTPAGRGTSGHCSLGCARSAGSADLFSHAKRSSFVTASVNHTTALRSSPNVNSAGSDSGFAVIRQTSTPAAEG